MEDPKKEVVLCIERQNRHGVEYFTASPLFREEGKDHPGNLSWGWIEPDAAADLELNMSLSEDYVHSPEIEYRSLHSLDLRRAKACTKLLEKIEKAIQREQATEIGDMIEVFAKCLGVRTVCMKANEGQRGMWHSDIDWRWMSVADGKTTFRRWVRDAEDVRKARRAERESQRIAA